MHFGCVFGEWSEGEEITMEEARRPFIHEGVDSEPWMSLLATEPVWWV